MTAQEMSGSTLHLFRQRSPSPSLGALRSRLSHEASCTVRSSERDISIPCSASPALPYCLLGLRRCFLLSLFSNIWSRRRGAVRSLPVVLPGGVQTMSKWSETCKVQSSSQLILWMHVWGRSRSLHFQHNALNWEAARDRVQPRPLTSARPPFLQQFERNQCRSAGANSNGIIRCNKNCNSNRSVKIPLKWLSLKQT